MISQEQWDEIHNRLMTDYHHHGDNALAKAMEDVQLLLMAAKPYRIADASPDMFQYEGTCTACMMGVCKRKESHT